MYASTTPTTDSSETWSPIGPSVNAAIACNDDADNRCSFGSNLASATNGIYVCQTTTCRRLDPATGKVAEWQSPSGPKSAPATLATRASSDALQVAIRLMQEPLKALMQSYGRTKARNLKAFRESMDLHTNSSNNTIFADADGNINVVPGGTQPQFRLNVVPLTAGKVRIEVLDQAGGRKRIAVTQTSGKSKVTETWTEKHLTFAQVKPAEYAAVLLIGGRAPEFLRHDPKVIRLVQEFHRSGKWIFSICHGVQILVAAGEPLPPEAYGWWLVYVARPAPACTNQPRAACDVRSSMYAANGTSSGTATNATTSSAARPKRVSGT